MNDSWGQYSTCFSIPSSNASPDTGVNLLSYTPKIPRPPVPRSRPLESRFGKKTPEYTQCHRQCTRHRYSVSWATSAPTAIGNSLTHQNRGFPTRLSRSRRPTAAIVGGVRCEKLQFFFVNIHAYSWIFTICMKNNKFFALAVELDVGREANAARRIQNLISRPRRPSPRGVDLPFEKSLADEVASLKRPHEYSFCPQNPVFSIPRSNSTSDAGPMRRRWCKIKFPAPGAPRPGAPTSGSAGRPPTEMASLTPKTHPSSPYAIIIGGLFMLSSKFAPGAPCNKCV